MKPLNQNVKLLLFMSFFVIALPGVADSNCLKEAKAYIDSFDTSETTTENATKMLKKCLFNGASSSSTGEDVTPLGDMWSQPVYSTMINSGSSAYYCLEEKCPEIVIEVGNPLWLEIQKTLPAKYKMMLKREKLIAVPESLIKGGVFIPKTVLETGDDQKIGMELIKHLQFGKTKSMNGIQSVE